MAWYNFWQKGRIKESFSGVSGTDPDLNLTATQGGSFFYRRLTQTQRDLPSLTQERMLEIAFWLYQTNPLARRILRIVRDFAVGSGLVVSSNDIEVQSAIDDFWMDPVNLMDMKLHSRVLELGLYGEWCSPISINPVDGKVRLGYIDSIEIADIVCDKDNVEIIQAIELKAKGGELPKRYKVVSVDTDPQSKSYGRLIGAKTDKDGKVLTTYQELDNADHPIGDGKIYDGTCFFFKVNSVTNAKRGWSDLLTLIDWIDGYDQAIFNEVDRALLLKSFIWDVTITGADDKAIVEYAKNNPAPKPASVRYHNEKAKWEAVTPDLKASDTQTSSDLLLSYIATGAGLPKTWLNAMVDVNLATATALADPSMRELSVRQKYVRYIIEQIVTFVLDQAELKGRLKRRQTKKGTAGWPEPWDFSINMPEMRAKDLNQIADVLNKVTQALAVARSEGAIDVELEQQVLVLLIEQLGVEIDLPSLKDRLRQGEEMKEDIPPIVSIDDFQKLVEK